MDRSLRDQAYDFVRDKLASGTYRPGRGLSDRTLAREMGMSRTPVREAIQKLETEGFVVQVRGSGTYPRRLTEEEIVELYDLREVLEGYAAARAAREMPASCVKDLMKLCDQSGRLAQDVRAGLYASKLAELATRASSLEERFHGTILAAVESRILPKIVHDLHLMERMEADWEYVPLDDFAKPRSHDRVFREHSAIAAAIAERSAARARNMMTRHVRNGRRHELASMAANNRGGLPPSRRSR